MKIRQNKEVLDMMESYKDFLRAEKKVNSPIIISEPKGNHVTSLYAKEPLASSVSFGNTFLTCEVRNKDRKDCSFQILSDRFKAGVVLRYDTGGGTHKNDAPHIPLAEQSITTPHFHRYDSNGFFLAYKTDLLNDPKQVEHLFDIEFGFPYFCQEGNMRSNPTCDIPKAEVFRDGELPFEYEDNDPLEGINF